MRWVKSILVGQYQCADLLLYIENSLHSARVEAARNNRRNSRHSSLFGGSDFGGDAARAESALARAVDRGFSFFDVVDQ